MTQNTPLPVDQVRQMKAQGMDNNKIIQTLQNDGFSSTQIFDAMNQADQSPMPVKEAGFPDLSEPASFSIPATQSSTAPTATPDFAEPSTNFPTSFQEPIAASNPSEIAPSNEELIEAIIDEKWNELVDDINKIIDWKNRADSRLTAIETNMKNLRTEFSNLHQGVLGRISDYDKNMLNVGADLKAMESMFSKVLPQFLENVQKLSDIAETIGSKGKKKQV